MHQSAKEPHDSQATSSVPLTSHLHTALRLVICLVGVMVVVSIIVMVLVVAVITAVVDRVVAVVRGRTIETRSPKDL